MIGFYIVGLHRSGTNYLKHLLYGNFECIEKNTQLNYSEFWKHSVNTFKSTNKDFPYIIIYKPIYQWVESIIYRKPDYGINVLRQTLDEDRYIKVEQDIEVTEFKYSLSDLVNLYRQTYENWIINSPEEIRNNSYVINYKDLIDDDKRLMILNQIKNKFNFNSRGPYVNISWGNVSQSTELWRRDKDYDKKMKDYYLNNNGLELDESHIKLIDKIIDKDFKESLDNHTNILNDGK